MADQPSPVAPGPTPAPTTPTATHVRVSPPFTARFKRPCAAGKKCLLGGQVLPERPDYTGQRHDDGSYPVIAGEIAVFVSRDDKLDIQGREAKVLLHKVCAIAWGLHVPELIQEDLDSFLA